MEVRRKELPLLPAFNGSAPDLSLTISGAGNVAPVLSDADKRRWRRARQKVREAAREAVETVALATRLDTFQVVSDDKQKKTGGAELDSACFSLSVSDTRRSRGGSQPGAGAEKKETIAVREEAAKTVGVELDYTFSSLSVSDARRSRGGSQPGAGAKKKVTTAVREEAASAAKEARRPSRRSKNKSPPLALAMLLRCYPTQISEDGGERGSKIEKPLRLSLSPPVSTLFQLSVMINKQRRVGPSSTIHFLPCRYRMPEGQEEVLSQVLVLKRR